MSNNTPDATSTLRSLVGAAEAAALQTALNAGPQGVALVGEVWAVFEIGPATKDLIRTLAGNALGSFNPLDCTYVVSGTDLVEDLVPHVPTHRKVIDAFVAPLRAQGFVVEVETKADGWQAQA